MRAILLVDHGSRLPAANAQLAEMARRVAARLGGGALVGHAHLELAAPSISEAIDALAAAGATEIVVCPYFLAPGRHASDDVPRLVREASARHAALRVRVTEPLGVHDLLADLVLLRCAQ